MAIAAAIIASASVIAFGTSSSDAATYDGEMDLYGYKITMGLIEPNQVSTVEWDFGDGSPTETVTLTTDNPVGKVQHTYSAKGDYVVTATMRNQYTDPETGELKDGESKLTYLYHIHGYPVVTFDPQGGSSVPSIEGTSSHYVPTKPSDPVRSGYQFTGWFKDAGCTQAFDWSSEVTKHTTLYAGWEQVSVPQHTSTLRYDANGGSQAPSDDTFTGESTDPHTFTVSSSEPVRAGYRFAGWGDSSDASSAVYSAGDDVSVAADGTKTVYAVWELILTVTSTAPVSVTVGQSWSYAPTVNAEGCTITISGADWMSVSGGTVSGAPMKTGTYHVIVTVAKAGCVSATQTFDVTVQPTAFNSVPSASGIDAVVVRE